MAEDDRMRVRVFEDYSNLDALKAADVLVTYTCDVIPALHEQEALRDWVQAGGRWYALHGTNSILRWLPNGLVDTLRWAPVFMQTLGSQFIAHPPITPYRVTVADREHPLVQGMEPFDASDEHYLVETHGDLHVLLETEFEGEATGFAEAQWPHARHPVFYIHPIGQGGVLYLTLGHYDLNVLGVDFYEVLEQGSWDLPVFYDLLRRGLAWCVLEHLFDPVENLHVLARRLVSGGRIAHATPCYSYRYAFTRFHVFCPTGSAPERLAARAGLRIWGRRTMAITRSASSPRPDAGRGGQIGSSSERASGVKSLGPPSVMCQQSSSRTPNSPGM